MGPPIGRYRGLGFPDGPGLGLLPLVGHTGKNHVDRDGGRYRRAISTDVWIYRSHRLFSHDLGYFSSERLECCESPDECAQSGNTETAYRFEIVTKIPYFPTGVTADREASHIWVKIRPYGSCAMLYRGDSYCIGDLVRGVLVYNYGGAGRSNLDAWRRADLDEWGITTPETRPSPADFDFRERVVEWIPALSGRSFDVDPRAQIASRAYASSLRPWAHIYSCVRNVKDRKRMTKPPLRPVRRLVKGGFISAGLLQKATGAYHLGQAENTVKRSFPLPRGEWGK